MKQEILECQKNVKCRMSGLSQGSSIIQDYCLDSFVLFQVFSTNFRRNLSVERIYYTKVSLIQINMFIGVLHFRAV